MKSAKEQLSATSMKSYFFIYIYILSVFYMNFINEYKKSEKYTNLINLIKCYYTEVDIMKYIYKILVSDNIDIRTRDHARFEGVLVADSLKKAADELAPVCIEIIKGVIRELFQDKSLSDKAGPFEMVTEFDETVYRYHLKGKYHGDSLEVIISNLFEKPVTDTEEIYSLIMDIRTELYIIMRTGGVCLKDEDKVVALDSAE
jgi:hypothetical protein